MKLEKQVVSLELSKRLKELNCKQESLWGWSKSKDEKEYFLGGSLDGTYREYKNGTRKWLGGKLYSAFTVAELGEMLPYLIGDTYLNIRKEISNKWLVEYAKIVGGWFIGVAVTKRFAEDNIANAMAKMLIYLLKHNLNQKETQ